MKGGEFMPPMTVILNTMSDVYGVLIGMFQNVIDMIVDNPLVFVPVLFAILGSVVLFAIGFIKKLGIKGISSAGGRRRGRR